MKSLFLILSLFLVGLCAGQTSSCCSSSATARFAMLSESQEFQSSHLSPLPFEFQPGKGAMVTFKTKDGKDAEAFVVKADQPTTKIVFMFHEWWGLNNYIRQEAEKLQSELSDVTVYAIDLYDGKVADNPQDAGKYMGEVKEDRAKAIIEGAIAEAGKNASIYTIGWCFGGGWSFQASLLAGKQASGCVIYYGLPETDLNKLKKLNPDVLGIFATQDKWINPSVVSAFEKNMQAAGKHLTVKNYDADHAFANPSNPKFNKEYS